ncbi:MAG: hypothetical protein Q9157_001691 [Trypethelium eluteriae]
MQLASGWGTYQLQIKQWAWQDFDLLLCQVRKPERGDEQKQTKRQDEEDGLLEQQSEVESPSAVPNHRAEGVVIPHALGERQGRRLWLGGQRGHDEPEPPYVEGKASCFSGLMQSYSDEGRRSGLEGLNLEGAKVKITIMRGPQQSIKDLQDLQGKANAEISRDANRCRCRPKELSQHFPVDE